MYESRLQTFLKVLREQDDVAIDRGRLKDEQGLSRPMQERWESGDFWVTMRRGKAFCSMLCSGKSLMAGSVDRE